MSVCVFILPKNGNSRSSAPSKSVTPNQTPGTGY